MVFSATLEDCADLYKEVVAAYKLLALEEPVEAFNDIDSKFFGEDGEFEIGKWEKSRCACKLLVAMLKTTDMPLSICR